MSVISKIRSIAEKKSRIIAVVIVFISAYLYLWLIIDSRTIYFTQKQFPVYLKGYAFLKGFLNYPGGLVNYVSAYLSQYFYYSAVGTFVIVLTLLFVFLLTDKLLRRMNFIKNKYIAYIPAVILLIPFLKYLDFLLFNIGVIAALFIIEMYLRISERKAIFKISILLILYSFSYYAIGPFYLFVPVICSFYEISVKKRWQIGILNLLAGLAIPYFIGVFLFQKSLKEVYTISLLLDPKLNTELVSYIIYLSVSFPLIFIAGFVFNNQGFNKILLKLAPNILIRYSNILNLFLILIISIGIVWFSFDKGIYAMFRVNFYKQNNLWDELLKTADNYRGPDEVWLTYSVNRALYYKGEMAYKMFYYPQSFESFALPIRLDHREIPFTLFELGRIDDAEHLTQELNTLFGNRPMILKQLSLINAVKGNIPAVKVYLEILSRDIIFGKWAQNYLIDIKNDSLLSNNKVVQRLRSVVLMEDTVSAPIDDELFLSLLRTNRQNRMAFEYLMSYYLLTRQLDGIINNIPRLNDFGYYKIPQHYEEALMVYQSKTGFPVDNLGFTINPETKSRFKNFQNVLYFYKDDRSAAFKEAAKKYGNTYYFYYVFNKSGIKQ